MHDQPPTPSNDSVERAETDTAHEQPPRPQPQIYVASLADYNNGRLHGEWLDAARDPADIHADITAMLARSREPDAEEFAIHDYDQFGTCRIHEYDAIELVSRIANGIREHGFAFGAWAEVQEGAVEHLDEFEDAYLGHYASVEAYAEQIAEDLGYNTAIATLSDSMQCYIRVDTAAMVRDIIHSGNVYVVPDPNGGFWIFNGTT
jgi:antirestriction protein